MLKRVTQSPFDRELGFGKHVTTEGRMMNADGSFNVVRQSLSPWDNAYYYLVTMSWWQFLLSVSTFYFVLNLFFAFMYMLAGVDGLDGMEHHDWEDRFLDAFFFSAQTLTTVGYGRISPVSVGTNIVAAIEAFTGLLGFAIVSGLMYGRFSRPRARIVFSAHILRAPFREGRALMFRMVNARHSELIETEVQAIMTVNQPGEDGKMVRRFFNLALELDKISFFSLSWTVVHTINEESPLWGFSHQDLQNAGMEILILVKSTEEANNQQVYARYSYTAEDLVWNARFTPIIGRTGKGMPLVYTRQVNDYEVLEAVSD